MEDITDLCKSASSELSDSNPMIFSRGYSPYDAMSAVELMDPKMDYCGGLTTSIKLEDLLNIDMSAALSYRDLLKVLCILFVFEAAFFDGASVLESTHQCKLLWSSTWEEFARKNTDIQSRALIIYVKSLLKTLHNANAAVLDADVYEEEDWQPLSKPSLQCDLTDEDILLPIDALLGEVDGKEDFALLKAFLEYRKYMHLLYSQLATSVRKFLQHKQSSSSEEFTAFSVGCVENVRRIVYCTEFFQSFLSGKAASASGSAGCDADSAFFSEIAEINSFLPYPELNCLFSNTVVRLYQHNIVRQFRVKPFIEAVKYMRNVSNNISSVCTSALSIGAGNSLDDANNCQLNFDSLLYIAVDISALKFDVVSRSLFWAVLQLCRASTPSLIRSSMSSRGLPSAVVTFEVVDQWLGSDGSIVRTFWDTLRGLCSVRSKLLARLDSILVSWATVMQDAYMIDLNFREANQIPGDRQQWISSWATIHVTAIMDIFMSVTVESDLLNSEELDYFYWYWDYIHSSRCWAMSHIREHRYLLDCSMYDERLQEAQKVIDRINLLKRSKKHSKTKDKGKEAAELAACTATLSAPRPTPVPILPDETLTRARGQVCRALFRMYILATNLGVESTFKQEYPFGLSLSGRFDQRFLSFQDIMNPPVLSLESFYTTLMSTEATLEGLVQSVSICFQNAKRLIEDMRKSFPASVSSQLAAQDRIALTNCPQILKVSIAGAVSNLKTSSLIKTLEIECRYPADPGSETNTVEIGIGVDHLQSLSLQSKADSGTAKTSIASVDDSGLPIDITIGTSETGTNETHSASVVRPTVKSQVKMTFQNNHHICYPIPAFLV